MSLEARKKATDELKAVNAISKEIADAEHKNSSPSVLAKWILIALDEAGLVITTKKTMQIYHEDQSEKEDMSCDNTM